MTPVKTRLLLATFLAALPLVGCSADPGPSAPQTELEGRRPAPGGGGDEPASPALQLPTGSRAQSTMSPYPVPNPWRDPDEGNEPVPNPWTGGGGQGGQGGPSGGGNGGPSGGASPTKGGHPVYAAEGQGLKQPY